MTLRKATKDDVVKFLHKRIDRANNTGSYLFDIAMGAYPFSWKRYCQEHKIRPELRKSEEK